MDIDDLVSMGCNVFETEEIGDGSGRFIVWEPQSKYKAPNNNREGYVYTPDKNGVPIPTHKAIAFNDGHVRVQPIKEK